ncbi:MAG TPA: tetratricopeptide repeat protein [Bryobacteraceae bacterium]|nr:tetratricopeptide repeat protein [Bryobacteraceae bacterium]
MEEPPKNLPGESPQPEAGANAGAPLVLIPVTAEDVSRRKRRIVLACWTAVLLAAGAAYWIYRHNMDPIHAQQSYDSGVRLFTSARYQQAILSFDRTIKLQPNFAGAYLMRGRALVADSKPERAIEDFNKLIALRPSDPQGFIDRGTAYLGMKEYPSVIADANQVIQLDPKLAAGYDLRGLGVRGLGDPRKALEDFNRAVELSPRPENYYDRGVTYQALGEHELAIADFTQVIEFHPDLASGYFARAESRRAIGDTKGAAQDHLQGRILDGR